MAETIPPPPVTMRCTKCGAEQALAVACRKCGLQSQRMPSFREQDSSSQPPSVLAAWAACEAVWTDRGRHEKFAAAVVEANAFAYAARQYRAAAAARPDDAIAPAQIERLRRMAEAALKATAVVRPEKEARPYKTATVILVACIVAVVFGLLYAMIRKSAGHQGELTPVDRHPAQARPQ